jgi:hypothetical protein
VEETRVKPMGMGNLLLEGSCSFFVKEVSYKAIELCKHECFL